MGGVKQAISPPQSERSFAASRRRGCTRSRRAEAVAAHHRIVTAHAEAAGGLAEVWGAVAFAREEVVWVAVEAGERDRQRAVGGVRLAQRHGARRERKA